MIISDGARFFSIFNDKIQYSEDNFPSWMDKIPQNKYCRTDRYLYSMLPSGLTFKITILLNKIQLYNIKYYNK